MTPKANEGIKPRADISVQGPSSMVIHEDWGDDGTSSKDLSLARLQLCQGLSQSVKDGAAKLGDIFHSGERRAIAPEGKSIELIPIICIGWWFVHTLPPRGKTQGKFLRKEPLTHANDAENWKQDMFDGNDPVVKTKCLSFLMLQVNQINGFPVLVDFRGTNKKAGMAISTVMQENRLARRPPAARIISLSASKRSGDGNDWYVYNAQPGRDTTKEELTACKRWFDIFSDKKLQAANAPEEDGGVL